MLMQFARKISVMSVIALAAGTLASTSSFADYGHGSGHHGGGHHGGGHHGGGGYGGGFGDGFLAAFASIYSTLISSDTHGYDADTLIQSAAIYEADGIETPVFEAFVGAMSQELTERLSADEMSKLDSETLRHMVAEQILKDAQ